VKLTRMGTSPPHYPRSSHTWNMVWVRWSLGTRWQNGAMGGIGNLRMMIAEALWR
jgi:hypothetical protein